MRKRNVVRRGTGVVNRSSCWSLTGTRARFTECGHDLEKGNRNTGRGRADTTPERVDTTEQHPQTAASAPTPHTPRPPSICGTISVQDFHIAEEIRTRPALCSAASIASKSAASCRRLTIKLSWTGRVPIPCRDSLAIMPRAISAS